MIAKLTGIFAHKTPTQLILDVQGVGYLVGISLHTYSAIQALDKGSLFIYTKVAEDAIALFGFATHDEQEIFEKLIGVNGVGANTARIILSHLKPDEVRKAIIQGNSVALEKVKGIGKKTAERMVLELKDKMGIAVNAMQMEAAGQNTPEGDALEALVALGIPRANAAAGIKKLKFAQPELNSVESIIKQVLKSL